MTFVEPNDKIVSALAYHSTYIEVVQRNIGSRLVRVETKGIHLVVFGMPSQCEHATATIYE